MVAYRRHQQTIFSTVKSEGAILPMDLLRRVHNPQDAQLAGLTPDTYYLSDLKLNEAINQTWIKVLRAWRRFRHGQQRISQHESGATLTRDFLLTLFQELNYSRLQPAKALLVGERSYPISHGWQHVPIHLVSYKLPLDHRVQCRDGTRKRSPHSLLQELLNHSPEHLWGIVSNGLRLRILRNNVSLTREAYVEFDLEEMFDHEIYPDFVLLWLLIHQSRLEAERPVECWLEKWSREAHASGTRALDSLRKNVEAAISELGSGFLSHPANTPLRAKLRAGTLSALDYYNQLLRLVYRLLVLFVAEDREILFDPAAPQDNRNLYKQYYSTARLRAQADYQLGTRHADLYYGLKLVMEKLGEKHGCPELGLPALNGFLFSPEAVSDLQDCQLANYALLATVRHLASTESGRVRRPIDYKNLGSEELGSVYESLLELHPIYHLDSGKFELASASGNARKTTGSYYTPTSLITCLLDSALDPVLNEAANQPNAEEAILNLKICDPACGSGHFLVAAAHRIAKKLAAVRIGDEEPGPEARRHALRDVVSNCIYGVDINPMAVELCKVSLWMEAIEPGKPLSFLDAHIQQGNSLLGATPALLQKGIPDGAFEPIEGDDKKICSAYKKQNKEERAGQLHLWENNFQPWDDQNTLVYETGQINAIRDEDVAHVHAKDQKFKNLRESDPYKNAKLWADAWCAAFVWKKTAELYPPITEKEFCDIGKHPSMLAAWRKAEIEHLAQQYRFFHWHLAFPDVFHIPTSGEQPEIEQTGWSGGFDVVLSNPPWEHTELKEQEWFATRDPEIANAAGAARKRKIEELSTFNPALYTTFLEEKRQHDVWSHFTRNSVRYPRCGRGRINTYAIFAENMRVAIGARGRVGCIVPSGIATDDTTKFFFQDLTESQSLVSFFSFINEAKLFPGIDHRVSFALLTMSGPLMKFKEADLVFGVHRTDDLNEDGRHFSLSARDIALLNPNTRTCPIFRSKRDMLITKAIYERVPVLIKEGPVEENPWNITFRQGLFNMTSDSHLFHTRQQLETDGWQLKGNTFHRNGEVCQPLYEGKMIWHFDHRFGTYEGQTEAQARQGKLPELSAEEHANPSHFPLPQYWVREEHFPELLREKRDAFLAFRDITNAAVLRTAIFSIIPAVPCGNNLPVASTAPKYKRQLIFLSTYLSSFVFDYVARQKVGGTHMNFFIVNQLPVFPPQQYQTACSWDTTRTVGNWLLPRALELTYTAWDLAAFARECGYDGPPFKWDEARRFLLRCELDAAYFHLYSIARDDVDYIMDTFRVWREKEEKQYGEYHTKHVILEIYDEMQAAMETGQTYRTRLMPGPADPVVAHEAR